MCHHKSAWLSPSGEIYHCAETDLHDPIARVHHICDRDAMREARAIRIELRWPSDPARITDMSAWTLTVDEISAPAWATPDVLDFAADRLRDIVSREIVTTNVGTRAGGTWIIASGGRITELIGGRIVWAIGADLRGADLRGANLSGANLSGANLSGANLRSANLSGANLRSANLFGANLYGADLYGANLSGADLYGADLYGADLRGANLSGANLSGANLSGANLYGANLYGAVFIEEKCPNGWQVLNGRLERVTPA